MAAIPMTHLKIRCYGISKLEASDDAATVLKLGRGSFDAKAHVARMRFFVRKTARRLFMDVSHPPSMNFMVLLLVDVGNGPSNAYGARQLEVLIRFIMVLSFCVN